MSSKTIYFFILILIFPLSGLAQYDSIAISFQKEFDSFNQSIHEKHQTFREKNDSIFSLFLKDSWATFNVFYKGKPVQNKPIVQPKAEIQIFEKEIPSNEIKTDSTQYLNRIDPGKDKIKILKKGLPEQVESGGTATINVNFYGSESKLNYPPDVPQIKQISSESISNYFDEASSSTSIYSLVTKLLNLKDKLRLNDWGYYKLIDCCIDKLETDPSSKTLLNWIVLIKSGYNVKIGFSGKLVYLLVPFHEELFDNYYVKINEQDYYFTSNDLKEDEIQQLTIHKANYPDNSQFSLIISQLPDLGLKTISKELLFRKTKISVYQNEQLINFYSDYPMCEMKVYFSTPISEIALSSLEKYFNPLFSGLNEKEKVAVLLEFTQKAFSYKSDKVQFTKEKYFFPDELFFYPYSDCEDRSVLFTKLVKHFTRLNCIALNYPGHVSTAVNFRDGTSGTFVLVNNTKYIVCDPTYINAPIGYLPDEFKGLTPKVIKFE